MALEVTRAERLNATPSVSPETASLNTGSMAFEVFPLLRKLSERKFDLKQEFLAGAKGFMISNAFETIGRAARQSGHVRLARVGLECHGPGHLFKARHFVDRDPARPSLFVEALPGTTGGAGTPVRCMLGGR